MNLKSQIENYQFMRLGEMSIIQSKFKIKKDLIRLVIFCPPSKLINLENLI